MDPLLEIIRRKLTLTMARIQILHITNTLDHTAECSLNRVLKVGIIIGFIIAMMMIIVSSSRRHCTIQYNVAYILKCLFYNIQRKRRYFRKIYKIIDTNSYYLYFL